MYVLDTDTCIALLKGNEKVVNKIAILSAAAEIYTTIVNVSELYYGAYHSERLEENLKNVVDFINDTDILNMDFSCAEEYGKLKSQLRKAGTPISDNDLFIASIVLSKNFILVTNNEKHFGRLKELKMENWLK